MKIEIVRNETYTVARLAGQLNTEASDDAAHTLLEEFQNTATMILDFDQVPYLSSSGMRVILQLAKTAISGEKGFVICGMNQDVTTAMKLTGFLTDIHVAKDLKTAEMLYV